MVNRLRGRFFILFTLIATFSGCAYSPYVPFTRTTIGENPVGFQWKSLGNDRFEVRYRSSYYEETFGVKEPKSQRKDRRKLEPVYRRIYKDMAQSLGEKGFKYFLIEDVYISREIYLGRTLYIYTVKGLMRAPSDSKRFFSLKSDVWGISNLVDVKRVIEVPEESFLGRNEYGHLSPLNKDHKNWFLFDKEKGKLRNNNNQLYYSFAKAENGLLSISHFARIHSINGQENNEGLVFDLPPGTYNLLVSYFEKSEKPIDDWGNYSLISTDPTPFQIEVSSGKHYIIETTRSIAGNNKHNIEFLLIEAPIDFGYP